MVTHQHDSVLISSLQQVEDGVETYIEYTLGSTCSSKTKQLLAMSLTELATNAFRHSDAKEVHLHLATLSGLLVVTLSYAGCDFDPTTAEPSEGLGLRKVKILASDMGMEIKYVYEHGQCEITFTGPLLVMEQEDHGSDRH